MSIVLYPSLHGLGLQVTKRSTLTTLEQPSATPGYETRVSLGPDPIYEFDLQYKLLRKGYSGHDEFSSLESFFEARGGSFDSFLLDLGAVTKDPASSSATAQVLTLDVNSCAPIVRTKPNSTETMYELAGLGGNPGTPPVIKKDGVALTLATGSPLTGDYLLYSSADTDTGVLDNNGIAYRGCVVEFLTSVVGHTITADFSFYYRVKFAQGKQQFEMFHVLLWKAQQVQLVGTRV